MKIRCSRCGKGVSSEVPDSTLVRAWLECPECVEKDKEREAEAAQYGDAYFWANIEGMESRTEQPNVFDVPSEILSREQANRICMNARFMEKELKDRDASFELRWNADMRAIKRWQDETGCESTWPDHADLCVWLLKKIERLESQGHCVDGLEGV